MPLIKNYRRIPEEIARDSEVVALDSAHLAAGHSQLYFTKAEADARYLNAGGGSGIAATIATSAIESALRSRFRSNFFIESHHLALAGDGNFPASFSNGAFGSIRAEIDRPGILSLATGSSTNGFANAATGMGNNSSGIILNDGPITYLAIIKIPILRDITNDFVVEVGFQSAGSTIGFDACCFVYDSLSLNWQCHTRNNGDLAVFTSNVAVTANQWHEMRISVNNGNASFSIDGIVALTTSQKLPLSPRMVGAGIDIRKIAGTTGREILIDYQSVEQIFDINQNSQTINIQSRSLTDADIPESITRDTEADTKISSAIATHTAELHTATYLTQAEADERYRQNSIALAESDIPDTITRDLELEQAFSSFFDNDNFLFKTKLDDTLTAIKFKLAVGTTPNTPGNSASIPLAVDPNKIIGFTCMVGIVDQTNSATLWIVPPGIEAAGYSFTATIYVDVLNVRPASTNSANVLNRPFRAIITYIE